MRGVAVACAVAAVAIAAALALRSRARAPEQPAGGVAERRPAAREQPLASPPYDFERLPAALPTEHHEALLWGTYRPGVYAGVKSRTYPHALAAGMMWPAGRPGGTPSPGGGTQPFALRHECSQEDGLTYGYRVHDGRSLGEQTIVDPVARVRLHTTYVRVLGGAAADGADAGEVGVDEWALHVTIESLDASEPDASGRGGGDASGAAGARASVFLYAALDSEVDVGDGGTADGGGSSGGGRDEEEAEKGRAAQVSGTGAGMGVGADGDGVNAEVPDSPQLRVFTRAPGAPAVRASGELRGVGCFALQISGAMAEGGGDGSDGGSDGGGGQLELREWHSSRVLPLATLGTTMRALLEAGGGSLPARGADEGADEGGGDARVLVVQLSGVLPFSAQLTLGRAVGGASVGAATPGVPSALLRPGAVRRAATVAEARFNARFDDAFGLHDATLGGSPLQPAQLSAAKRALSLLLGSHAFMYGTSRVRDARGAVSDARATPLFCAVPSRAFFPRGFLWDDGFHQLVVARFDAPLAADVLLHWAALVQPDGWLAREQILGDEARARVPTEFVAQSRQVANPPTLLLLVEALVARRRVAPAAEAATLDAALAAALPALERWFGWLLSSQSAAALPARDDPAHATDADSGVRSSSAAAARARAERLYKHAASRVADGFYWRGRSAADGRLNAMTLASGLDDYPRATEADAAERHVDLICWLAAGARALGGAAAALPSASLRSAAHYAELHAALVRALAARHWDPDGVQYADVGRTTNDGRLVEHVVIKCERARDAAAGRSAEQLEADVPLEKLQHALRAARSPCPRSHPVYLYSLGDGRGGLLTRRRWKGRGGAKVTFVRHTGYVSLFPLMLRLIPADSAALGATIGALTDEARLWTPHGLRSLSRADPLHGVENAPGDAPYWRGAIWINLNYLALAGLHHYGACRRGEAGGARAIARVGLSARAPRAPCRARARARSHHARPVRRASARRVRRAARQRGAHGAARV